MPVARVKDLSPLRHSGQRRLQLVVGSIDTDAGSPRTTGLPRMREIKYPDTRDIRLKNRRIVIRESRFNVSVSVPGISLQRTQFSGDASRTLPVFLSCRIGKF